MLNCWEREADQRPTFTKLVSQFHDTILPGTPGADNGGTYVLLGPEEDKNLLARAKSLHETSVLDITIVSRQHVTPPVSDGMTFDVVFLSPGGTERMYPVSEKVDSDCYMDMSSVSHEGSVIVNPGAEFNEYDNVTADCQESGDDGHMTTDSGHVTTTRADHVTHSNRSNGIHEHNEYILMHSAGPVVPNSQK